MLKLKALLEQDGGIDTKATRIIWNSTLIKAWDLRITVSIRVNRLWTQARTALIRKRRLGDESI